MDFLQGRVALSRKTLGRIKDWIAELGNSSRPTAAAAQKSGQELLLGGRRARMAFISRLIRNDPNCRVVTTTSGFARQHQRSVNLIWTGRSR